jgi:hypothetical protein
LSATINSGIIPLAATNLSILIVAQLSSRSSRYNPEANVDRTVFRWGARFTAQEIHDILKTSAGRSSGGWFGDSVEKEWASAVVETTASKHAKLRQPGYRSMQRYWLAAYASSPGPALDLSVGATYLPQLLASSCDRHFEQAFLLSGRSALRIASTGPKEIVECVA